MIFDHLGWFPKLCVCCMFSYRICAVFTLNNWSSCFSELYCIMIRRGACIFGEVRACPVYYSAAAAHQGFSPGTTRAQPFPRPQLLIAHLASWPGWDPWWCQGRERRVTTYFPEHLLGQIGEHINEANTVATSLRSSPHRARCCRMDATPTLSSFPVTPSQPSRQPGAWPVYDSQTPGNFRVSQCTLCN